MTPKFNYRVAGLAVRDGNALIGRAPPDGFWALPGGRVDAGEHLPGPRARRRDGPRAEVLEP